MVGEEREAILEITSTILETARLAESAVDYSSFTDSGAAFQSTLDKLNTFFKKIEDSFKDFIIFERYVTCAYTSDLGFGLRDIPEEIRERVWETREDPDVCGFTGEECKCKKSLNYLKERFTDTIQRLSTFGETIKAGSDELKKGIEELGREVERLTLSAQKIMGIAEIIEIIALNAYIEAARLGESGRGFKVIADEVRRASVRTNELASEIIGAVKELHNKFAGQMSVQESFESSMVNMEREHKEFSDRLNRDLLWMSQNFMDFLEYMRSYVKEDISLLEEVRGTLLSALKATDTSGKSAQDTKSLLRVLASMVEALERGVKGEEDLRTVRNKVYSLREEFRSLLQSGA